MMAMKNKMGAAVEIAIGSSLQIALFVAPVLSIAQLLHKRYTNEHCISPPMRLQQLVLPSS